MENNKLSIILLSYYSGERILKVYEKVKLKLGEENIPFEFIIMDDGSQDISHQIALELENSAENVKAFQLSKNYTSHYSAFAGLSVCEGGCATIIPDDEQQPYDTLVQMYRLWEKGEKVVIPFRETRGDPAVSKMFSQSFYRIMNSLSEISFPKGGADSFFIDREVIDILNNYIHPINTTTITEILRLGYSPYFLPYERPLGDNKKSRWSFKKKVKLAKDFFFSSSTFPIKFITSIGIFFSAMSALVILIYTYAKLWGNEAFWKLSNVPGWTSTIVIISFFSGLTLFSLGIIAEYIWRIYEEVKARPGYIIKKKKGEK